MSQSLKIVLALIFVTALGWVLLQPVLDAVEPSPRRSPEEGPAPEEARRTQTGHEPAELPEGFRTQTLFTAYPKRCLRARPPASDVIAVERGGSVAAGGLEGIIQEFPARALTGVGIDGRIAWSNERGIAIGTVSADRVWPLTYARDLVWSPIAPCALVPAKGGSTLLVLPSREPLVRADVRSVAFSPDGRKVALVLKEERATSVWVASLSGDRMREVMRVSPDVRVELRGWSPTARTVYYDDPSGGLSFVTTSDPPQSGRVSSEPIEQLEYCGDRLLGIRAGAVVEISTRGPHELTAGEDRYRYLSCSPNGDFIAAIGRRGLVLLDPAGGLLRELTQDSGYTDVFVDWGEGGAGVIFGRVRSDPVAAEIWHLAEGGSARATGITYRGGPGAVDWAASPPTGLP